MSVHPRNPIQICTGCAINCVMKEKYVWLAEVTTMEVQQVYHTNIKHDRCWVECIMVVDDIVVEKFIVDTGAMYTCCNYWVVSDRLDEDSLKNLFMPRCLQS